jgi:DeoR family glycerol-3-phosphate regulon repressor
MILNPLQRRLLKPVRRQVTVSVDDPAQALEMTPQTVRRDVKLIEEAQLLAHYHSGVGLPSSIENIDHSHRQVLNIDAKRRITMAVAQRVRPSYSLLINVGTTAEEVARTLVHHSGLHVVTNKLNVAAIQSGQPDGEVIVAGGIVRGRDRGIVGEATVDLIRQFKIDVGIIGGARA